MALCAYFIGVCFYFTILFSLKDNLIIMKRENVKINDFALQKNVTGLEVKRQTTF